MKLEGVLLYYDKENGNGRIYTKECAGNMVEQFKQKEQPLFGELGQSESFDIKLSPSHIVKDVWIDEEDKSVKGTIEILETPKGKILEELLNVGCDMSITSRGLGTVNNETKEIEDYQLISFDIIPTKESSTKGPIKITDL
jgi:hypothetical protein